MDFASQWAQLMQEPLNSFIIVLNLTLIESILSIDNATVLAIMVRDLPKKQQDKALHYGILGAYLFRGLALIFASQIMKIWWLKVLGGAYLIYISMEWFMSKKDHHLNELEPDEIPEKKSNPIYKFFKETIGKFWGTVIMVEVMDIAFSIDNVFAAVAFSDNMILICIGVFIGILAMRYVASFFNKWIEKYPFLENSAFIVIFILGLKLFMSLYEHYYPDTALSHFLSSHEAEIGLTIFTLLVFILPIIISNVVNYFRSKNQAQ